MNSRGVVFWIVVGLLGTTVAFAATSANKENPIDIPYTRYVLDNGLTLIVHEDHKAPIVAVNVWYHVGSKNEKPGKTGFAHLFEHLMFNGSENHNDDYFKMLDQIGATDTNGTTNTDRTNYFQNVPSNALDVALWLESDRMGHLLGAITQEKLDEQRGVVQNEKRQGENQPYGRVFSTITQNIFPQGHPYSWSTIGSMDDLEAASLEDVHEWFKAYYGAANAVISIAGDVEPEVARARVEAYFGDIPSGPPVTRQEEWIARRTGTHRQTLQDRVPQARIYKVWNIPPRGTADADYLDLLSDIIGTGKTSRLYRRLVYEDQIATGVGAAVFAREIAGGFILWATAVPGADLKAVERAIDEELERFFEEGPTRRELERVVMQQRAAFVRGIERIGGFGGKSDILAQNEVYTGNPDHYKIKLERSRTAKTGQILQAARRWLKDGEYVLEVQPFPKYGTVESSVDRAAAPPAGAPPEVKFPRLQRATLSNGLKLVLAERHAVPVVRLNLLLDAGFAADKLSVPGTAGLALDMLDEGTTSRTALEISEQLSLLGARLGSGSNLDVSSVSLSALKEQLDPALDIYADVILNPAFSDKEFKRLQKQTLAAIQREKQTPLTMALRVLPRLLYGESHSYGTPFTGSGDEQSVKGMTTADLKKFHETWFRPNRATLVVVGDTTLDEITPKLERLFGDWKRGTTPEKNVATVSDRTTQEIYLIDRPGSVQSIIFAGHLAPPKSNPDEIAIEAMNEVLGGSFNARINMNLREDKGWSYGARSLLVDARGQRPFIIYAPVQTDKTKESMQEIVSELRGIIGSRPPTDDEVIRAKNKNTLTLPGRWETSAAVSASISEMVRFDLPDTFWERYPDRVRGLDRLQVTNAAKEVVHPDRVVWVIVGDREKIEAGIRELKIGDVQLLDADGNRLDQGETTAQAGP